MSGPQGGPHISLGGGEHAALSRAVAPHYRYCSGATFTVAVAPLLLIEKYGYGCAATFSLFLLALPLLLSTENVYFEYQ